MEKLKEKYGALYDAYVDINNNPKSDKIRQKIGEQYIVDSFTAMEGIKYRKNDKLRFMLVGWAPNGWGEKRLYGEVLSRDSFIYSSIMNLTNDEQVINNPSKGRFEWIADGDEWGHYPHNCYREGIDSLEDKEKIEKSPYHLRAQIWSYPKEVWCRLAQQIGHENSSAQNAWINRWYDNIVWSNLYKLYPVAGGNPNDLWKKIQFKACADLLLEEIRYFQPSHILFATDEE